MATTNGSSQPDVDVVVVGAGFAGLYMLHRLRQLGFSATVLESADDVGGTWYWNRYPGARCDIPTTDYTYSFDPELETGVDVVGEVRHPARDPALPPARRRQARPAPGHPVLDPCRGGGVGRRRVARGRSRPTHGDDDRLPLRTSWRPAACRCPRSSTSRASTASPGDVYFTSRWPHEGVDFTGKRVGVIGTGSSGIQSIPLIAEQAARAGRVPAHAELLDAGPQRPAVAGAPGASSPRTATPTARPAKWSRGGVPVDDPGRDGRRRCRRRSSAARFEAAWEAGELFAILGSVRRPADRTATANDDRRRASSASKIRAIVDDPETAETLCPTDHPFGTKRPCLDTDYYATFNLPHVRLVDLRKHADHDDHRDRHRHDRRVVRVRRHRLRHRLRRHDRRHRRRRHHRPRRRRR